MRAALSQASSRDDARDDARDISTYVQTYLEKKSGSVTSKISTAVTRTHAEPSQLLAALIATFGNLGQYAIDASNRERWPLTRFGDRERIPAVVRRLILERDGGCCLGCGIPLTIRTARLDHIVPWSAGGPDTSDNLRILCEPCNEDRSNFRTALDDHAAIRPPVALCCTTCAHLNGDGDEISDPYEVTPDLVPAYCGWCGIVSPTWPEELY